MSVQALLSSILVVACVSFSGFAQTPQAARPTPDSQILLTRAQRIGLRFAVLALGPAL
jgi:hypothetical protein